MTTLSIQLLGEFRLVDAANQVIPLDQPRQHSLLTYLLLHAQTPQPRRQLAFRFWPDTTEAQAQTNLRQLLHHLRRAWPAVGNFVQIEARTLQWKLEAACALDVAAFTTALTQATAAAQLGHFTTARTAYVAAVEQYTGDLLPGCYDEWLLTERERLRQCFLDALEQLMLLCEETRDYAIAIHYAQRLLRADPLHESTYRQLMRLYALNHDQASALRAYQACTTILARELGVEPSQETQAVYLRLLKLESPALSQRVLPGLPVARDRLIGRQAPWKTLLAVWQMASRGHTHFVIISGEAGIGKTRLVEELLTWAARQGIAQARTRSYAAEGSLAYAPITEWLRATLFQPARKRLADLWLSEVARLLPELLVEHPTLPKPEPLTERWQRQRFFEALARLVLAAPQPLLLVIDDLQWCDQETLEWLSYLLRYDPNASLLLVGTVRPEEITVEDPLPTLLHHIRLAGQLIEIELGPLTAEETTALATQIAARPIDAATTQRLYDATEGNPLFIVETVRAALNRVEDSKTRRQEDKKSGGEGDSAGPFALCSALPISLSSLPPTIYRTIQQRLARLSPAARSLVDLVATIGRSCAFDLLVQASDREETEVITGLDELWQRRIIREQSANSYDFSHDRIREVAYSAISPARRRHLHRRVAVALEQSYPLDCTPVSAALAFHYAEAGLFEKAVAFAQQAMQIALALYAYNEAIRHLQQTLTLLKALPETRPVQEQELALLLQLNRLWRATKGFAAPEVGETCHKALALCHVVGNQRQRYNIQGHLLWYYANRSEFEMAHQFAAANFAIAQEFQDQAALNDSHLCVGMLHLFQGELTSAHNDLTYALTIPIHQRAHKDGIEIENSFPMLLTAAALNLWLLGYPDQARQQIELALVSLQQDLALPDQVAPLEFILIIQYFLRDHQAIQTHAVAMSATASKCEMILYEAIGAFFMTFTRANRDELPLALDALQQSLALVKQTGVVLLTPYYLALQAEALGLAGRSDEALARLDEAIALVEQTNEGWLYAELLRSRGDLLLATGAAVDAVEGCYQAAHQVALRQKAKSLELRATISLARLWQTQGRPVEARTLVMESYGWFTEGFDTADLQEAENLLKELSS